MNGSSASVATISTLLKRKSSAATLGAQKLQNDHLNHRPILPPSHPLHGQKMSLGLEDRLGRRDINDTYFR